MITQAEVKRLFTNLKPHVASVESHFTDDTIGDDVEARGDDRRENSIRSMQEVYDYLEKQCGHYSVFVESLITRAPCVFACTRRNPELGEDVTELRVGHHPLGESIGILDYNSEKARWFLKDESELALSSEEAKELFYFYHNSMREAWVRKTARDLLIYPGKAEELSRILQDDKTTGSNKKIIALVAMKLAIIEGNAKRFYQIHKVLDDQVSDAFELFYKAVSGDKVPVMGYEVSLSDYFAEIISSPESFESLRDYLFPPIDSHRVIESESQPIVSSDILVEVQRDFLLDPQTEGIKEEDFLKTPEEFKDLLRECVKTVFYLVAGNENQSYSYEDFATSFAKAWWAIMSIRAFSKGGNCFSRQACYPE